MIVSPTDYTLHVSVQEAEFAPAIPHVRLEGLPGRNILKVGAKAYRAVSQPLEPTQLIPTIEALPRGSSFVRDEGELDYRIDQASYLWHSLQASKHPWAEVEADQARKITLQRGGAPGWWVAKDGMVVEPREDMNEAIDLISDFLLQLPEWTTVLPTRYKQHTNHGWPDYSTSDLSYVLHALWARCSQRSWDEFQQLGASIASAMDQHDTPFSSIMFSRSGPLGKFVDAIDVDHDVPVIIGQLKGLCARKRIVLGNSSAGNMLQKYAADALKRRIQQVPHFYHPGGAESVARKIAARQGIPGTWFSDDITAFDNNVRPNHLLRFSTQLNARLMGDWWREFKYHWSRMPLLGPRLSSGAEAFLWRREGGIASGTIDTAIDGTLVNAARVVTCVAIACGVTVKKAWEGRGTWWTFFNQGDDTLIHVPTFFKEDKYVDASNRFGYPCKLSTGMVFLMNAYTTTGLHAPLASRVFQQTVFNEYGGQTPACELFSFIARATPAFWQNNPWAGTISQELRDCPIFKQYGVSPATARAALSDPVFTRDLQQAKKLPSAVASLLRVAEKTNEPILSDFVSAQLSVQLDASAPLADSVPLPDARKDLLRIASFMGKPTDERPDLTGLSPAVTALLNSLPQGVD